MHTHTKPLGQRKVSPPGPTFMSNDQMGSRPIPGRPAASTPNLQDSLPPRAASALSTYRQPDSPPQENPRSGSAMSHRRTTSQVPGSGPAGRPLVQEPRSVSVRKNMFPSQVFSHPVAVSPVPSYRESRHRHQEKEEARSLRDALQGMDIQDDVRIHHAAQDEATELVWMHQNPGQQFKNPFAPYRNPDTNRDGSIRSQSRKSSESSNKFRHSVASIESSSGPSSPEFADSQDAKERRRSSLAGNLKKNLKVNFALPGEQTPQTNVDPGHKPRTVSGDSSKGVFRNPDDHIYEESDSPIKEAAEVKPDFSRSDSSALQNKPRNVLPRATKPLPWLRDRKSNGSVRDKISQFDIHKNPPSQSRNPSYIRNAPAPSPPPTQEQPPVPMRDGKEIRSGDIRAATSKKLADRSEKLPMPSAVSDRFGRPIVSFDPKWQPSDQPKPVRQNSAGRDSASPAPAPAPPVPSIEIAAPSIEVSEPQPASIPVISVPDIKEPTISEFSEPTQQPNKSSRPLPPATGHRHAPPRRQAQDPQNRTYTPYTRSGVPTASCKSCSHGISGKIVTAGGCRFHPECFVCFHCHTALECVAFYQEPEANRAERLANAPEEDNGVPRFYCHLDFHEMFSPRCKSCKTPIEGEVVVACGAEWHVGHFFCAECGDPFNSQTPFVEKDGFAWCLQCYSRRTAPRCLGCKQHVLDDVVITAVGGQWHESCFACHECGDGFGPEGRFFIREGEPKRTAKGRIIGGPVQLAICERCEGIRLKAPGMC
ncbi:uncharacterized protein N7498_009773 [Penicillium cinerascens]|uniref:LIM zinc-binding domain-containing protein n=1 Tax=Penicillium cinerascens TaxID=70096 RepID=A0A9W9J666_9EURO|nr:uncharacterized protein N7498_009773 [Penicillium cinerascens]KAJ5190788.1 hypothetical protein N7498_009773 [Penicillium cinerascens]